MESALVILGISLPVLVAFIMVMVIPFILGSYYAFTNWTSSARVDSVLRFVGFENFINSLKDPSFLYSFGITFFIYDFKHDRHKYCGLCAGSVGNGRS